ncbi:helicase HerA domain-containing protein [Aeropyrum camini]|uniref:Bipolar DNA helicase n=1 Tax=Aeropyrum camini SY1 = JCM 12091 TaxID=1198449 RepID=U3T7Q8_9CREN|nr:ATP-binding protein [Aeropyrum camini]BAN89552.1 bipolar DNA helicase [Aeropyrum camini SY1 = JCM 12091]
MYSESSVCGGEEIGVIIGESSYSYSTILLERDSLGKVIVGSHVVANLNGRCVLGIVESIRSGLPLLSDEVRDLDSVKRMLESDAAWVVESTRYHVARARWVSYLDTLTTRGEQVAPKIPPQPGSAVYLAEAEVLKRVFAPDGDGWLRVGSLLGSGVEYRIDVNKLTRHLAILAVTGGGKSNTVCVITRGLVSRYGVSTVIFDRHGEYGNLGLGPREAKLLRPARVNPASLSFWELLSMAGLEPQATVQKRILRWLWGELTKRYQQGKIGAADLIPKAVEVLETASRTTKPSRQESDSLAKSFENVVGDTVSNAPAAKQDQILGVLDKLNDLQDLYGSALDPNIPTDLTRILEPGKATVMDLSMMEDNVADAVTSHYLRRLLQARINVRGENMSRREVYPVPVITIIEEAHVLIPKDEPTLTKRWAARIAREGRKFGVGMVIVSQRPKKLDVDVLSQTNNKIILKMVEPQDIGYVRAASEELSEDLASLLPSLNTGEALIMGSMARMPAVVKIDKCEVTTGGRDINIVEETRRWLLKGEPNLDELAL